MNEFYTLNDGTKIPKIGFGTYNEGRAVCSALNISMAKSYPKAERMHIIN